MSNLFGTDGIRGRANEGAMSPETLLAIGKATGFMAARDCPSPRIVIGKDTRLSGYMVESAISAGLIAAGAQPILLGPLPTPAVSMLTHSLRAEMGIMITASHNPYEDNGVKFFRADGSKLCDSAQAEIERLVKEGCRDLAPAGDHLGRASRLEGAQGRYVEAVKNTLPAGMRLNDLKIVLDSANGAAYKVAPQILWELGADVVPLNVEPNGRNINDKCGATDTRQMRSTVIRENADIGIALDGDGDRIIVCDEKGQIVDGDQILGLVASSWRAQETLCGNGIAATVMSNMGLDIFLSGMDIKTYRTAVGDRHVVKCMREQGLNLGGEQSGHIVMGDYACTGDGLIAGLQVLATLIKASKPASEVGNVFEALPQVSASVRFANKSPLEKKAVKDAISDVEAELGKKGRLLVRKSGTEPLVRIMVEGEDRAKIERLTTQLSEFIEKAA